MEEKMQEIIDILENNGTSDRIAILSLIVSAIAVLITIYSNIKNSKRYIDSLKPMLAFKLYEKNGFLVLHIVNNGQSEAKNIIIDFLEIEGNGRNKFLTDELFSKELILYPTEEVQGVIALSNESVDNKIAPKIKIKIRYIEGNDNKHIEYERNISFKREIQLKDGLDEVAEEIRSIAYSNNRLANYIEGRALAKFDELNVLPQSSFFKDIKKAINSKDRDNDSK